MPVTKNTYSTITPYLCVPDADVELRFLKTAFDAAEVECQRNPDQPIMHAEIRVGDSLLMLGQSGGQWKAQNAAIYLWVPEVDKSYTRAIEAGAVSQSAPEDKPYGHRSAGVVDQNGITWWIASPMANS